MMKMPQRPLAKQFARKVLHLASPGNSPVAPRQGTPGRETCTVLVVNSSQAMAREMTMQLIHAIPWCSILYAPTFALAALMVRRRKIDLVVSSTVMPDGGIDLLTTALEHVPDGPDLVVVSDARECPVDLLAAPQYRFLSIRKVVPNLSRTDTIETAEVCKKIQNFGAEVRNDLNNPLQEIVAMVFVAKAHERMGPSTDAALSAIESAAQNMAEIVWGIEERLNDAVIEPRKALS
jgi:hypothetical protein